MKRPVFKFDMENVLVVRKRETERARHDADNAAASVFRKRAAIEKLRDRLRLQLLDDSLLDRGDLNTLKRNSERQSQLRLQLHAEERALSRLVALQNTKRTQLLECKMKEETVAKLREQAYERYKRELEQGENALTDELVQMSTARTAKRQL